MRVGLWAQAPPCLSQTERLSTYHALKVVCVSAMKGNQLLAIIALWLYFITFLLANHLQFLKVMRVPLVDSKSSLIFSRQETGQAMHTPFFFPSLAVWGCCVVKTFIFSSDLVSWLMRLSSLICRCTSPHSCFLWWSASIMMFPPPHFPAGVVFWGSYV